MAGAPSANGSRSAGSARVATVKTVAMLMRIPATPAASPACIIPSGRCRAPAQGSISIDPFRCAGASGFEMRRRFAGLNPRNNPVIRLVLAASWHAKTLLERLRPRRLGVSARSADRAIAGLSLPVGAIQRAAPEKPYRLRSWPESSGHWNVRHHRHYSIISY
jgi:hypothetical protein